MDVDFTRLIREPLMVWSALYGYAYWLTGSRAAATEVVRQAQLLGRQHRGQAKAFEETDFPEAISLATTLCAELPEERRSAGWLPPPGGPAAPPLLVGLAGLSVTDRAALLLRHRLGFDDRETSAIVGSEVAAEAGLNAVATCYSPAGPEGQGNRARALADLAELPWPRPSGADVLHLEAALADASRDEAANAAAAGATTARSVRTSPFAWAGMTVVTVIMGWLLITATSSPAAEQAPQIPIATAPAPLPTPSPTVLPPVDDPSIPEAAIEWLRQNTGSIRLDSMRQLVADARIVVIGDGTWGASGASEFHREREHLTEHLVDDLGFDTLILQAPGPAGGMANLFIRATGGGFDALARSLAGPWATREFVGSLEWLRQRPQIAVDGFLPPLAYDDRLIRTIEDFLSQVDPRNARRARGNRGALLSYLEQQRPQLEPRDPTTYQRAVQNALALVQYDAISGAGDPGASGGPYERFMLKNLFSLLDDARDRKVVVWASDFTASQLPALGSILPALRERYAGRMVSIGFMWGEGRLYALREPVMRRAQQMIVQRTPPPLMGTLEAFLKLAGPSRFLVDLRGLDRLTTDEWTRPRTARRIDGPFSECFPEDYLDEAQQAGKFDAVLYSSEVTPATLLDKPPVATAAPCVHAPQNLDFSLGVEGWERGGTARWQYRVGADSELRRGFVRALDGSPNGTGTLFETFRADGYVGRTVRLAGRCLVDSDRAKARLFIEAAGPGGKVLAQRRTPLSEARRYPPCTVHLDIPAGATRITVGLLLEGPGEAWVGALGWHVDG